MHFETPGRAVIGQFGRYQWRCTAPSPPTGEVEATTSLLGDTPDEQPAATRSGARNSAGTMDERRVMTPPGLMPRGSREVHGRRCDGAPLPLQKAARLGVTRAAFQVVSRGTACDLSWAVVLRP